MKNQTFNRLLKSVSSLSHSQRQSLRSELNQLDDSKKLRDLLEERIEQNPHCPHCESSRINRHGIRNSLQRYRCKNCGRTFNCLTGTSLARLRDKELWPRFTQSLLASESVRKAATELGINSKTSFRWRHRFLQTAHADQPQTLSGIVEADETYFRESEKGKRNLTRPPRKRGEKASRRGLSRDFVSVLVACDRNGHEADYISGRGQLSKKWLQDHFFEHLKEDVLLVTDGAGAFRSFCSQTKLAHVRLNLSTGQRVRGIYHIQHVNAYHHTLKTWMVRFHGVATHYLEHYLGWCHELFSRRIRDPFIWLRAIIRLKTPLTGT